MDTTTVEVYTISLAVVLAVAWIATASVAVFGRIRGRPVWIGIGLVLAGVLAFLTIVLVEITTLPLTPTGYDVSLENFFVIGLGGFFGGALAMLGGSYIAVGRRAP